MLFFIMQKCVRIISDSIFKYISCYSLSLIFRIEYSKISVFKYISCYSLSLLQSPGRILSLHLNTSHVILYPLPPIARNFSCAFKYISCYSLSFLPVQMSMSLHSFKYISCYSLSIFKSTSVVVFTYLNTSHVILYLELMRQTRRLFIDLNTSHVILYPAYLSHFLTVILLQPLYLSGFLLYFTTLDPLFQFLP